jgi:hypothetical protein
MSIQESNRKEDEFINSIIAEEKAEKMHNQTAHNLSMITGYIVEQTIGNFQLLKEPITRNRVESGNNYGRALELANGWKKFDRKASNQDLGSYSRCLR